MRIIQTLLVLIVLFATVMPARADCSEASYIAQGEVGAMGDGAILFVLTQLRYDYDSGVNVPGRWYGWTTPSQRTIDLAKWVWAQDGYLYPRCRFTISEQDRLYFISLGWIGEDDKPDYTFALSPTFKAHGFFCHWPEWANEIVYTFSRSGELE